MAFAFSIIFGIGTSPSLASVTRTALIRSNHAVANFIATHVPDALTEEGDGRIRWQDISYQPFMETKFLLGEAQRLLKLPKHNGPVPPMKLAGQKQTPVANCK